MKKVEIYSTPSCHFCHMAKEYFSENGIEFSDYDVAKDTNRRSEMVEKSGQLGVPVIVVDDRNVVVGFDRTRLSSLLGIPA